MPSSLSSITFKGMLRSADRADKRRPWRLIVLNKVSLHSVVTT